MSENPELGITLLGHFQAKVKGEPVSGFESDKVRGLLAYLVVESERSHTRSALAGLFWPERPERNARQNLSQALSNLRTVIGDRGASPPYLLISQQTIQFNTNSNYWLDVHAFTKHIQQINQHGHDQIYTCKSCIDHIEQAASLGIGGFLEGFYLPEDKAFDDWHLIHREKHHRQITGVLNQLIQCHSYQEAYDSALNYAWELLNLDRWREDTHRQLMRLLALTGRRSAALMQYETCRAILKSAFGVTPDAETTRLYDKIRTGEISQSGILSSQSEKKRGSLPTFLDEDTPEKYQPPVFIGGTQIIDNLFKTLFHSLGGNGQVVFVYGGPGRGKTTLIQEFIHRVLESHPDLLPASGSCNAFSGPGDPYLPFREILAVFTGDLESQFSAGTISRSHAQRMWDELPLTAKNLVTYGQILLNTLGPQKVL